MGQGWGYWGLCIKKSVLQKNCPVYALPGETFRSGRPATERFGETVAKAKPNQHVGSHDITRELNMRYQKKAEKTEGT